VSQAANATGLGERVRESLEGIAFEEIEVRDAMPCLSVSPDLLHETLRRLRDDAGFETITIITSIDHLPAEPRFEVIHQLHSIQHAERVRIKTRVSSEKPALSTCTDLWPGAAFMEREVFDLMGVVFEGHENLRRLLMPEEYPHHPLRKDFPQRGIEPERLYREWDRQRHDEWRREE
jgi:NADH:ubiquinone oxidoreductase subunit C